MSLAFSNPIRAFALVGALAVLASPAAADSLKVNVSGLDAKTAHARIVQAAEQVCGGVLADEPLRLFVYTSCVDDAVAATEAKLAANERHLAALRTTGH
jgi:UrcA family protein